MAKEVILTGVRSNGELTLGNYLGAILPMVQLQQAKAGSYQLNFFIPDLHSFTTPIDHSVLLEQTRMNLRTFAAAGFDYANANTYIYRQSYIPAHSELFTVLNNFAYFGELSRMTQFKEKKVHSSKKIKDEIQTKSQIKNQLYPEKLDFSKYDDDQLKFAMNLLKQTKDLQKFQLSSLYDELENRHVSSGLFTYPVLMAADILLYGSSWVPVGEDQRQHLELTRDLAMRMNNKFGDLFTVPHEWAKQLEFSHRDSGVRIRSLSDPTKKMSKSVDDPRGTILLTDNPASAAKKVMSATTDSFGEIQFDMKQRPGISNLLQILALLTKNDQPSVIAQWQGKTSYGELKKAVAASVEQFLVEFQKRYNEIDDSNINAKLESSESAMNIVANQQLYKVQQAVGLRPK